MRLKVPSVLLRNNSCNLTLGRGKQGCAEVAGVTFSDSNSAPVPKFFNPGPEIFQNWESDSGYYRCNPGSPLFLLQKWPRRLLLLPKLKSDSGTVFSRIFDFGFGSERKTQNPAGVDDSGSVATSAVSSLLLALREPVFPLQNSALSKCLFQWARNRATMQTQPVNRWKGYVISNLEFCKFVLRRFFRPKPAINASTSMKVWQKKSSGTTHQATEMMTWRTLRHHLKTPVNPANVNSTKCKQRSRTRT